MHRLIVGESGRFPTLAAAVAAEGASTEAITLIADLLERENRAGRMTIADPELAAEKFLHPVLSVQQRRALGLGAALTANELERWVSSVVDLFVQGCRRATRAPKSSAGKTTAR